MKNNVMFKLVACIAVVILVGAGVYIFGFKVNDKSSEPKYSVSAVVRLKPADVIRVIVEHCKKYESDWQFAERMDKALYRLSTVWDCDEAIDRFLADCTYDDLDDIFGMEDREMVKNYIKNSYDQYSDSSFCVIDDRLEMLGITRKDISKFVVEDGSVCVKFRCDVDPERVRKVLSSSALVEFWSVARAYEASAVYAAIAQNNMLGDIRFEMGDGYYCVGIADKSDIERINDLLKDPANKALLPARTKLAWENKSVDGTTSGDYRLVVLVGNAPLMDGSGIVDAKAQSGDPAQGGGFEVFVTMDSPNTKKWANVTANNVGEQIAIVMDDVVYSAPVVRSRIDGPFSISGRFSVQEAEDLANVLKSGCLPCELTFVSYDVSER